VFVDAPRFTALRPAALSSTKIDTLQASLGSTMTGIFP